MFTYTINILTNNKLAFYNIVIRTIYFAEIYHYTNFRLYKYLLKQERKNSCAFDIYKSDFHSLDKEIALPKIEKKKHAKKFKNGTNSIETQNDVA